MTKLEKLLFLTSIAGTILTPAKAAQPFPTIVSQPSDQTVACRGSTSFSVSASGPELTYFWTVDGRPLGIPATNAVLNLTNVLYDSGARFRVVISNSFGAVASDTAVLTVTNIQPPGLTISSDGLTNLVGWPHSCYPFTMRSSSYVSSFMTNWVTAMDVVRVNDASNYTAVPNVGTNFYQLQTILPIIIAQPLSVTSAIGSNVTFTVVATNPPSNNSRPLIYSWRLNGIALPNGTNATLTLSSIQRQDGGSYSVVVANDVNAVQSEAATLKVSAVEVTLADNFASRVVAMERTNAVNGSNVGTSKEPFEPRHAGLLGGKSVWLAWVAPTNGVATFDTKGSAFDTVVAVYTNNIVSSLTLIASDDDGGGYYTSRVQFNAVAGGEYEIAVDGYAGDSGNISLNWTLESTSDQVPVITTQPQSQTVRVGSDSLPFTVGTGPSLVPLSFQWKFNGVFIPGATNSSLTIANAQLSDVGRYTVLISSPTRSVESSPAYLDFEVPIGASALLPPETEVQFRDKVEAEFNSSIDLKLFEFDGSDSTQGMLISVPVNGSTTLTTANPGSSSGWASVLCNQSVAGFLYPSVTPLNNGNLSISCSGAKVFQVRSPATGATTCAGSSIYISNVRANSTYSLVIGTPNSPGYISLSVSLTP